MLAHRTDPQFSQPIRQIISMIVVVVLAALGGFALLPAVEPILFANPYLNGFIGAVFLFGVAACFWQIFIVFLAVNWIEGFALDRPGHEFTPPPRLLAPLAALLANRRARRAVTATSARSILDSVATRLDEQRDLTRYIVNLLIFLGLLGTFYGLATVVPAVVDTIRGLAPEEGQTAISVFDNLMSGLENQLSGMGTAFASSLLGLAGSLVVGLLELFSGHGQNRFYRQLEEWLSSITKIGLASGGETEEGFGRADLFAAVEQTSMQIDVLRDVVEQGVQRSAQNEARLTELAGIMAQPARLSSGPDQSTYLSRIADGQERLAEGLARIVEGQDRIGQGQERLVEVQDRLAEGQERLIALLEARGEDGNVIDAETRARLRSIDTQVLRILEDMAAGRQDLVTEMRQDIAGLAEALRAVAQRGRL